MKACAIRGLWEVEAFRDEEITVSAWGRGTSL